MSQTYILTTRREPDALSLDSSSSGTIGAVIVIVGGVVAALAIVGMTLVALLRTWKATGGTQHMRVRGTEDPGDIELRSMSPARGSIVVGERLPLQAETVLVASSPSPSADSDPFRSSSRPMTSAFARPSASTNPFDEPLRPASPAFGKQDGDVLYI